MAAGRSKLQDQIEATRSALADRTAPASFAVLAKSVGSATGHVVGLVADALDESDARLLDLLPDAFTRLTVDPVKRDPGCRGKVAIAKALDRVERRAADVFECGARLVQHEPVWGGKVDTAAELRGVCGMALVHMRHPRALVEVALLLADAETAPRVAAARALAVSGDRVAAEPLLRLRLAIGDPESEVLGECFAALLSVAGTDAVDDVAAFMRHPDETTASAAALALGGSRLAGVFALLRAADESMVGEGRRSRLLAIALVRSPEAWDYLLELVGTGSRAVAEDAARALLTFRHDHELVERVVAAAKRNGDRHLVAQVTAAVRGDDE